ncbi:MAG: DUF3794 domain-containing protein [Ruminococcaceae bacterium]|nr:DUF3794 domain-containing protein [Oscillospiraceae bacterium]
MTVNFERESINLSELKKNESSILLVEGDVIVPDVNPDIKKILMTDAQPAICEKIYENGKITVSGDLSVNVLYSPDISEEGAPKIKSLCTKLNFSDTFSFTGENPSLSVKAEIVAINCTLLNSRKVNLKITLKLSLKAYIPSELSFISLPSEELDAETKKQAVTIHTTPVDVQKEFIFSETISVPAAKCDIEELLKTNITVVKGECKVSEEQLYIKGTVSISTLYSGFTDSFIHETMEHELPFAETLYVEGLSDDCICNVTYDVKDFSAICQNDENGDMRELLISLTICANITASKIYDVEFIDDLYFPGKKCELKREKKILKRGITEGQSRASLKNTFSLPKNSSALSRVYSVVSNPVIREYSLSEGKLSLIGDVTATVLYSDTNGALHSETCEFSFRHDFDIDANEGELLCEYDISLLGTNFNIYSESEIEIRTNVEFFLRLTENFTVDLILECNMEELPENTSLSQLVIYFVQKGDTLWNIAKHYNTTVKSIKDANKLESDLIIPGQKLLIPVK